MMKRIGALVKTNKPLAILVVTVLVAIIARAVVLRDPDTGPTHIVVRSNLVDTIKVSGTYSFGMQKNITSTSTGIVAELFIGDGDYVEKGDKLFRIESTATADETASAYASYQTALANFNTAKSSYRSKEAAVEYVYDQIQGHENDESYEMRSTRTTAEAARDNAYYLVVSTEAALQSALLAYQATQDIVITAPVSGAVANLLKKEGDQVLSERGVGMSVLPAETVLVIANLENPHLITSINEVYLPRIKQSLPVSVVFDSLPQDEYAGYLEAFETIGSDGTGMVSYSARIGLNGTDEKILPGMTGIATIETFRKNNVLTVPNSALIANGDGFYVMFKKGKEMMKVDLGERGISETEIVSGLNEGDVIFTNPRYE